MQPKHLFYYMSIMSRVRQKLTLESMVFMSTVSRVVKQFSFVYNSLINGPIFNPIEILELSQSPSMQPKHLFYYMSIVSRVRQKLTLESMVFMSTVSRVVKQFSFVYNSLINGPIFNPIEILKLSQSPLCSQSICFITCR